MKKFNFRLETFLKYKKYKEKLAQMDVSKAQGNVIDCENKIIESKDKLNNTKLNREKEAFKGIESSRYIHYYEQVTGIEFSIEVEKKHKKELINILNEKIKILANKSTQKRVVENYKDRQKDEYYDNILKAEQKEIDNMIIVRKARDINQENKQ